MVVAETRFSVLDAAPSTAGRQVVRRMASTIALGPTDIDDVEDRALALTVEARLQKGPLDVLPYAEYRKRRGLK